jgi:hypothetical protein
VTQNRSCRGFSQSGLEEVFEMIAAGAAPEQSLMVVTT